MVKFSFTPNEFDFRTAGELADLIRQAKAVKRLVYGEITVTPEMAAHMLDRKCDTIRPIVDADVDAQVRDHLEKGWDFNGDNPKFNKQGKLFDGQKRCTSCIASGRSFKTVLCFNSPPLNVNSAQHQSTAERMTLPNKKMCAALAKLFHMEELGKGIFDSGHKLTPREVRQFQVEEGDELVRLARLQSSFGGTLSRHAHYAFFAYKMEEALDDTEVVKEFFDSLAGGAERGTPVMKLRNRLAKDHSGKLGGATALTLTEKCHFLVRAFVADFTGEDLGKLQLPKQAVTQKSIMALLEEL